jgi:hypothetical protein
MTNVIYALMILGWGDREDEFYNCGTYDSLAKAEAGAEEALAEWEANGGDRTEVVWEIEELIVA